MLDKAAALRTKRQQAIARLDTLLQSVFLDMFGDPVTNPKGWDEVTLGKVAQEVRYGTSQKCFDDQINGAVPILRIPNVSSGKLDWSDLKYAELSRNDTEKLTMEKGDIVFVRSNGNPDYIGRCAVFDVDRIAGFASYLIRVRLKDNSPLNPVFIKEVISMPTYRFRLVGEARTTAGNYNISGSRLKTLSVIKPPKPLQEKFLDIESKISCEKEKWQSYLNVAEKLFSSLQQRAFRGEL